jgi:hypothetical protein
MSGRFRLRADVQVELGPDGGEGNLRDPVFDRSVNLGMAVNAVARRLDGQHTLDEIADEVHALAVPREKTEEAFRMLAMLNLVEGSGSEVVAKMARVRAGYERPPLRLLDESRFGCQASGDCCQNYHFGPLEDSDVALLASLDIAGAFPHLGPGPYYEVRELTPGRKDRYLKSVNERCVFLLDDCRCGLHARFGAEQKPGLCRYYPFDQFTTLDGIQMYDRGGCSEFATTARSGESLAAQLPTLLPLFGAPILLHPVVLLGPRLPADFGYWKPLADAAVEDAKRAPLPPLEVVRALARRLHALSSGLRACPLDPAGPGRVLSELLARDPADFYPPAAAAARSTGGAALAELSGALAAEVTTIIAHAHLTDEERYSARQSSELIPILQLLGELGAHLAGGELSPYAAELGALAVDDPEIDVVLRLSLRNQLFGHQALIQDRPWPALARVVFVLLASLWGARLGAAADGRARVVAGDLSRGHMLAQRVFNFRSLQNAFVEKEELARAALEVAPLLARWP